MRRHIASLQRYVQRYEHSAIRPVQFLSFIKTARLAHIPLTIHNSQLSSETANKEDMVNTLSAIQITKRGNRRVRNKCLLILLPVPEFNQSFTVTYVYNCTDIFFVTPDKVWVSDREYSILMTNTQGFSLYHMEDSYLNYDLYLYRGHFGLHTVSSEDELIYVDSSCNINKF